jgi:hypothetical protein
LTDDTNVTENPTPESGVNRLVCTYQIAQAYRKRRKDRVDKGEKLRKTRERRQQKIIKIQGQTKTIETLKRGYKIHPADGGTTLLRNVGNQLPVHTA